MTLPSSDISSTIVVLALFSFIYARRIVRSITGTRISVGQLFGFTGFYVALFLLAIVDGITLLPTYLLGAYAAVVIVAGVGAERYVRGRVDVHEQAPGVWMYRLSPIVPVVYLLLFIVRLLLDLFVLSLDPFVFTLSPPPVASQALWILAAVNLLFSASTGLLVGRNVAVYRAYQAKLRAAPAGQPLTSV